MIYDYKGMNTHNLLVFIAGGCGDCVVLLGWVDTARGKYNFWTKKERKTCSCTS